MGPLRFTSRGKNCEGDSQKPILGLYFLQCRDPMGVVVGEIKEVLSLQMLRDDGKELLF